MRTIAKLQELTSDSCKHTILRNLSRILDIRVLDIDIENSTISFVYDSARAFEKAKKELWRIGYPISKYTCLESKKKENTITTKEHTVVI